MPASSGFQSSPGHAALGDVLCIAPADRYGHRNGQRQWNMFIPLLIVSLTISIAKDHVMNPLKLKLRHSDINYNVFSRLLCFGRPLTTMDAVLATNVAGGQANIN